MKKKIKISLALMVFALCPLVAQNELSLSEAIQMGLENNYDLTITANQQKIAQINNTWANTSFMPTLTMNLGLQEDKNYNKVEDNRSLQFTPQINLDWVLFDGFGAQISKKRYEELESESDNNTELLVENTIQDIILAYNSVLLQQEMANQYKVMSDLSKDRMEREEESKKIGVSTTYNYLQYKTSYLKDYSNYLKKKVDYENAMRSLNYVLAIKENKMWNLITPLVADTHEFLLDELTQDMQLNNHTLKNQYIQQRILALNTRSAHSAYYPMLKMNGGVRYNSMRKDFSESSPTLNTHSTDLYAGLTLSWSIFSGGSRQRAVAIAKINEVTAEVAVDQMTHALNNQLLKYLSTYNVNREVYKLTQEQRETAKLNLELSKQKYESGAINSFNFRDVQVSYLDAVTSNLQAIYSLIESHTDLLQLTGNMISYETK